MVLVVLSVYRHYLTLLLSRMAEQVKVSPQTKSTILLVPPGLIPVTWHRQLSDIPTGFSVIVANEFLDALPIHQFKRSPDPDKGLWHEVLVDVDHENPGGFRLLIFDIFPSVINSTQFRFVLSPGETLFSKAMVPPKIRDSREFSFWESCPDVKRLMQQIGVRLTHDGGCVLLIDYVHNGDRKTPSLRSYR